MCADGGGTFVDERSKKVEATPTKMSVIEWIAQTAGGGLQPDGEEL